MSTETVNRNTQKSRDYRNWATNELCLWILNDETMYNSAMKIVNHPKLSKTGKIQALKRKFYDFHNGQAYVGRYARFSEILESID